MEGIQSVVRTTWRIWPHRQQSPQPLGQRKKWRFVRIWCRGRGWGSGRSRSGRRGPSSRLPACWVVQASGWAVTPRMCMCRVMTSMTTSTDRRLRKRAARGTSLCAYAGACEVAASPTSAAGCSTSRRSWWVRGFRCGRSSMRAVSCRSASTAARCAGFWRWPCWRWFWCGLGARVVPVGPYIRGLS